MIEVHARERVIVLRGEGEWDLATVERVRPHMQIAALGTWPVVVIDLANVAFMDVVGARPLRVVAAAIRGGGRQLFVIHPQPQVERLLALLHLDEYVVPLERLPEVDDLEYLLTIS